MLSHANGERAYGRISSRECQKWKTGGLMDGTLSGMEPTLESLLRQPVATNHHASDLRSDPHILKRVLPRLIAVAADLPAEQFHSSADIPPTAHSAASCATEPDPPLPASATVSRCLGS
jgi:hypothetical protein